MDDRLKKRLIGATVLVSLVVIFVPMLLQHEPVLDQGIQGSNIPPRPQRDYDTGLLPRDEEDISKPLKRTMRANPAERLPFTEPLVPPEDAEKATTKPSPKAKSSEIKPIKKAPSHTVKPKPVAKPRVGVNGWIIQLGSFSKRANAEKLVRQLKAKGFAAEMEPATVKGKTLYRVLVGPEADRNRAEKLLARLDQEVKYLKLKGKLKSYP